MHIQAKWPTWLSVVVAVLIFAVYFARMRYDKAGLSESRVECAVRLRAVLDEVRRVALGNSGNKSDGLPSPFDPSISSRIRTDCPVVSYLTGSRCSSPFLLVYGVLMRGASKWIAPDLSARERLPIVFVSDDFGQGGRLGEGLVCYADGVVQMAALPQYGCQQIGPTTSRVGDPATLELVLPLNDPRFPYAKDVAGLRIQFLGAPCHDISNNTVGRD
jgi:hypothetical protein